MPFGVVDVINFIFSNILWFIALGLFGWIIYNFLKVGKRKLKVVDRKEIERVNFIERMRFNPSAKYRWLYKGYEQLGFGTDLEYRGVVLLGKITHYLESVVKSSKDTRIITLIVKPALIKSLGITNPFKKSQIIQFENDMNVCIKDKDNIYVSSDVGITNYLGIYHQIGEKEKKMIDNIRDSDIRQTDIDMMASVYFVKSQEQATFDPNYAHQMAMREKELQIELAKRKGKSETL